MATARTTMTGDERLSTGLDGLDAVLHGGLVPERGYMVTGRPGTGKTILGLHYLTAGDDDRPALFVNLEEAENDVRANAVKLGFDLDGVAFLDLSPGSDVFTDEQQYDVFAPQRGRGVPGDCNHFVGGGHGRSRWG
ncbi:MAG: ATPase domain-containing protein, partial [Haloarculaceae archaeon]